MTIPAIGSRFPVRERLLEDQQWTWQRLSSPGTWWTGPQRLAIAAETRHAPACSLCLQRKDALSPREVAGEHDSLGSVPEPYLDAVHRIVTDSGRLSEAWLDDLRSRGLEDGPYIELVAVAVFTILIDVFHRGLGLDLPTLPEPESGEPSGHFPAMAQRTVAWVPMVSPADGLDDVYDGQPIIPYVRQSLSLVPEELRNLTRVEESHYLPMETMVQPGANDGRALSRVQIELLAARTSLLHDCFY